MAEEDDDDTFGDFTFSSFNSNPTPGALNFRSNGRNSTEDDDEWGDFVKSPQQSKPYDPEFNSLDGKVNSPAYESVSPPRWMKPSGALPLSIFGDAEEEEEQKEKDSGDSNQGKSNAACDPIVNGNDSSMSRSVDIANLYDQAVQIKHENGAKELNSAENEFDSSLNLNGARSGGGEWENVNFDGIVGINDQSKRVKSESNEFSFEASVLDSDSNQKTDPFGVWNLDFNELSPNSNNSSSNVNGLSSHLDMNGRKKESSSSSSDDDGDDGWQFKGAYLESRTEDVNTKVDSTGHEVFEGSVFSPGSAVSNKSLDTPATLNGSVDLFATSNGSVDLFATSHESVDLLATSNGSVDLFATSNGSVDLFATSKESVDLFATSKESVDLLATSTGTASSFQEVNLISSPPSTENPYEFILDTNSKNIENDNKDTLNLNPSPDDGSDEFDEDFGEFSAASAESGPKPGEKDANVNFHEVKGPLPLSIFGNEEAESDGSSDIEDDTMQQSTSDRTENRTPTSAISINDLISSLYSQSEQTSSLNTPHKTVETQSILSNTVSNFDPVNDFDDNSWEFKGPTSQTGLDNEALFYSFGDTDMNKSSNLEPDNYLDFYSRLKEELSNVAKVHIEGLKARNNSDLSGEDAPDSEFELAYKELEKMNAFICEERNPQDHPSGDSSCRGFVEFLLDPQFQKLESEYHLSEKLLLAEKDLKSAMELMRHTTTMLKILTFGTSKEQTAYISIWADMISVCAQELKHGALIWNQAADKHVQSQILAKPQGRDFVLSLGEVYRVVVVLGASVKLFKPWIISCSSDSSHIYNLLEECHALWSNSGLEDSLYSLFALYSLDDESLLKSINHIRSLDTLAIQNHVFIEREPLCQLSLLTAGVAPGMQMIMWGEEQCFVTLANLWANLISRNPPKFPCLHSTYWSIRKK